jgi:hypothetical protein
MPKWLRNILEWTGYGQTIQAIAQAEFVRTFLIPTVLTVTAAISGWLGDLPLMWIVMASALTFMGAAQGMLRGSEYLDRKNPQNKIVLTGTRVHAEMEPTDVPWAGNRKQRRAGAAQKAIGPVRLGPSDISVGIKRTIDKVQVGVNLKNVATFPISIILVNASTEVAGEKPPRSIYPRPVSTMQPGASFFSLDDAIELEGLPAGRLEGKLNMTFRYGLPGKERFELHFEGDIDIHMEEFGFIAAVSTSWKS